jgi:uncharacterized protein (DUF2336 family)
MTAQITLLTELEHAIAHGSAHRRAEMLMHVTDLFIHGSVGFSDDEIDVFDGVICRLAAEIEVSVRSLLAQRLAPVAKAPLNITRMLASDDEIRVASPILVQSERLDDTVLVQTARSQSQEHLLAISRRKSLSEVVTDVLVERGNKYVVLSTAKNSGAKFSTAGFTRLVKRSDGDDALAECVGARPDIPYPLFLDLLATASEMVRSKLTAENPTLKHEIRRAVATVSDNMRNGSHARSTNYTQAKILVQTLHDSGQLGETAIRRFATKGNLEEITAALARMCDVPIEFVEQTILEHKSETMLILAKAAKLSWPTTKILLSLRAGQRAVPSDVIEQCLASFERLNFSTAQQIIKFYKIRGPSGSSKPV